MEAKKEINNSLEGKKVKSANSGIILTCLFMAWIVSYVDRTAISLALTSIGKEFNLDPAKLGIILSTFFMGYALMQIPGGWLADRFGSRKVITVAITAWSIFTGLTGMAASYGMLLVTRIAFGFGEGGYPAASTKAISDYFPKEKRTKAQSTMMSSNMLGSALAPLIIAPILVAFGWRNMFLAVAGLGVLIVAAFLWFTRGSLRRPTHEGEVADASSKPSKEHYAELLRTPILWQVLLVFFFVNIANWGIFSWMPTYLMKVMGVNLKSVGIYASIPALFGAISMIVSGSIISKLGDKSKYGVVLAAVVQAAALFLVSSTKDLTMAIVYMSIAQFFVGFTVSFIFTMPHRMLRKQVVGTAFGIVNTGGQIAGIISPMAMGFLISATGGSYASAFIFLAGSCAISAVVALTLPVRSQVSIGLGKEA